MTFTSTPFAQQNVPINADVVRQAVSSLVPNGGGVIQSGDLAVSALATPGMSVQVAAGRVWIDGNTVAHLSGQGYGKQAQYFGLNDTPATLTIAAADPTNPRIDVVYVAIQDSAYAGTTNGGGPAVVTGIPNATPQAPAIPSNAIALAQVSVAANASSITNSNITAQTVPVIGPNRYWPEAATPTSPSGWSCTGTIDVASYGAYKRVTGTLHVNRTGGAFTPAAAAYTSIGGSNTQILPNDAIGGAGVQYYIPGVVVGGSSPIKGVVFINGGNGAVSFMPDTSFTWSPGMFFDTNINHTV